MDKKVSLVLRKCGDDTGVIRLYEDASYADVTIGRSHFSTIILPRVQGMSRMHARINFKDNAWTIMDLDSVNGTFVNNSKLVPAVPVRLSISDQVRFGVAAGTYRVCKPSDAAPDSDSEVELPRPKRKRIVIPPEDSDSDDEEEEEEEDKVEESKPDDVIVLSSDTDEEGMDKDRESNADDVIVLSSDSSDDVTVRARSDSSIETDEDTSATDVEPLNDEAPKSTKLPPPPPPSQQMVKRKSPQAGVVKRGRRFKWNLRNMVLKHKHKPVQQKSIPRASLVAPKNSNSDGRKKTRSVVTRNVATNTDNDWPTSASTSSASINPASTNAASTSSASTNLASSIFVSTGSAPASAGSTDGMKQEGVRSSDVRPKVNKWNQPAAQPCANANATPLGKRKLSGVALKELLNVLHWKTTWFQNDKEKQLTIVDPEELVRTKPTYNTPEEYRRTYRPLMLLEAWQDLVWAQRKEKKTVFSMELENAAGYYEDDDEISLKAMLFGFNVLVPKHLEICDKFPNKGWLCILTLPTQPFDGHGQEECVDLLAYVYDSSSTPYIENSGGPRLERLADGQPGEKILLKLTLMTKLKALNLTRESVFKMKMLVNFERRLQTFEALANVTKTPLGSALVNPKKTKLCTLPKCEPSFKFRAGNSVLFDDRQRDAIMRVTAACFTAPSTPAVALINGPPGTGKTAVICGLLAQLLYLAEAKKDKKPLIILCAPTDSVTDDDARRLKEIKPGIKIVRLGQLNVLNETVRSIHVDNLINKNDLEKIEHLRCLSNALSQKLLRADADSVTGREVEKLRKDLVNRENDLSKLEIALKSKRNEILSKADVIATTLGTGLDNLTMKWAQDERRQPAICIVDEAVQCVEPDMLTMLLEFGITKLVLVGDLKQVAPTILSATAIKMGYGLSLFDRLHQSIEGPADTSIINLEVQYRMHAELCQFPSRHFYDSTLVTASPLMELRIKNKIKKLLPYAFYDVVNSCEVVDGSNISNPTEVNFVTQLVELVAANTRNVTIGVLTFYAAQKHMLIASLKRSAVLKSLGTGSMLEINTVDGFQGREKDVIVVSCVRARGANGNIGLLKSRHAFILAMTRARYALYVCGHANSLMVNENWKALIDYASERGKLHKVPRQETQRALNNILKK